MSDDRLRYPIGPFQAPTPATVESRLHAIETLALTRPSGFVTRSWD